MWKQEEQSASAALVFVHIGHSLGMVAGSGFHTTAGPMEMPGCLQVQKNEQVSHCLPFNLTFKSVTRCLSGLSGEKQVKQRLRKGVATLFLPAEATGIPVGTQDGFTSKHCWNGLMDIFLLF